MVEDKLVTKIIQPISRDTWADIGFNHNQRLRRQLATEAHLLDFFRRFNGDHLMIKLPMA